MSITSYLMRSALTILMCTYLERVKCNTVKRKGIKLVEAVFTSNDAVIHFYKTLADEEKRVFDVSLNRFKQRGIHSLKKLYNKQNAERLTKQLSSYPGLKDLVCGISNRTVSKDSDHRQYLSRMLSLRTGQKIINTDQSVTTIQNCFYPGSLNSDGTRRTCKECHASTILTNKRYGRHKYFIL